VARRDLAPRPSDLRLYLAAVIPDFMVPSAFVCLSELPTTSNGKLDRRRLPVPTFDAQGSGYRPPSTKLETLVADIWRQVLGLGRVGLDDDFFQLGGHSLIAGEVVARTREALGRDVPMRLLFAHPTVAQFASAVEAEGTLIGVDGPIPQAPRRRLADLLEEDSADCD
jgi:acyl carrier protein